MAAIGDVVVNLTYDEDLARAEARWRKADRFKIALPIYLDLVTRAYRFDSDVDRKGMATIAVEAADDLLEALDHDPAAPVLPDYEG